MPPGDRVRQARGESGWSKVIAHPAPDDRIGILRVELDGALKLGSGTGTVTHATCKNVGNQFAQQIAVQTMRFADVRVERHRFFSIGHARLGGARHELIVAVNAGRLAQPEFQQSQPLASRWAVHRLGQRQIAGDGLLQAGDVRQIAGVANRNQRRITERTGEERMIQPEYINEQDQ